MKNLLLSAALMCFLSMTGFSNEPLRGGVFNAPTVDGTSSVDWPVLGDIIFDDSGSAFYGYDGTQWINLGASATPASPTTPGIVTAGPSLQEFAGPKSFLDTTTGTKIAHFEQSSALATSDERGLVAPRMGQVNFTVTGTGWTTTRAVGIYYQDQDGNLRLKFNLSGTISGQANSNVVALTVSGITGVNSK
ncbi:hypothetical protein [Oligoflexus tunisiensis]|uniref:hypothetical protein n=1 Tax=Oligoflexus tunisiensis TaxID=708132 RepID=UPI000A989227|nr:hypothetical protein [Oligoflexus tunisiensis]